MLRLILLCLGITLLAAILFSANDPAQAQAGQWGTVKGAIVWGGKEIPEMKPLAAVEGHQDKPACHINGNKVLDESWVINPKNKGVQWTFVWLANEDPDNKKAPPVHPNLKAIKEPKVVM